MQHVSHASLPARPRTPAAHAGRLTSAPSGCGPALPYLPGCNDTAVQKVKITKESVDLSVPSTYTDDVCVATDAAARTFNVAVNVTLTGGARLDDDALTYTFDPATSSAMCTAPVGGITASGTYTYTCSNFDVGSTKVTFTADTKVASESLPDVCTRA